MHVTHLWYFQKTGNKSIVRSAEEISLPHIQAGSHQPHCGPTYKSTCRKLQNPRDVLLWFACDMWLALEVSTGVETPIHLYEISSQVRNINA